MDNLYCNKPHFIRRRHHYHSLIHNTITVVQNEQIWILFKMMEMWTTCTYNILNFMVYVSQPMNAMTAEMTMQAVQASKSVENMQPHVHV